MTRRLLAGLAAVVAGLSTFGPAWAQDADQASKIRFGLGLGVLAEEQCGLKRGAAWFEAVGILTDPSKNGGVALDEKVLVDASRAEALATLAARKLDLCDTAGKVAKPDGIIVKP